MKKMIYFFAYAIIFATISCKNNDDDANSNSGNFSSTLLIDGDSFTPNYIAGQGSPGFTDLTDSESFKIRDFSIYDHQGQKNLAIGIVYDTNSINNSYEVMVNNGAIQANKAYLRLIEQNVAFNSVSGNITVTELGDRRFRLDFDNVLLSNDNQVTKVLDGSVEGKFRNPN